MTITRDYEMSSDPSPSTRFLWFLQTLPTHVCILLHFCVLYIYTLYIVLHNIPIICAQEIEIFTNFRKNFYKLVSLSFFL